MANLPETIWYGQPWSVTLRFMVDGVVYSLLTADRRRVCRLLAGWSTEPEGERSAALAETVSGQHRQAGAVLALTGDR